MTWTWHNPNQGPTPAELAAWADGELGPAEARRVEGWLRDHPEAADEIEAARRLVGLFHDHPAPDPSPDAWQTTLDNIHAGLSAPTRPLRVPAWRLRLILGLSAAAALVAGVLVAGRYWPREVVVPDRPEVVHRVQLPPGDDNDEPFAVVSAREIAIINMSADDADRLMLDQPLLGTIEFAAPEDIEVVLLMPDPEEGNMPRLQKGPQVPMIVLARNDDEEP
jgi:hypothetical protein